jgi:viologen exporter family transport system ATP-binding protein
VAATAVSVEGLAKTFQRRIRVPGFWRGIGAYFSGVSQVVEALSSLSFSIEAGEAVGLIGENGAGKSTLVKVLTGLLMPTLGSVRTLGRIPFRERRRLAMNIGVVFGQRPQLLWDLPAVDTFQLLKAMYRIPEEIYRYTYTSAVERFELGGLLRVPVRMLSLGQRMRCELAAALLHAPQIAFLDEPTIGLDVLVKERVREHLREMRSRFNMTLVFTTHDFKDITTTCDRIIALDKGHLLYDGNFQQFEQRFGTERSLSVDLLTPLSPDQSHRISIELEKLGASAVWETARHVVVSTDAGRAPGVTAMLLHSLQVRDLKLQPPDMDTLIARLYDTRGREHRQQ